MPPRNATGTNTAHSTSTIATTAPDTSSIASSAASNGRMSFSRIRRSTFSSTTMASSTTMPIASTSAKSVSVFMVKPSAHSPAKAPMSETGTAIIGMIVARQVCRKTNTTASTRSAASKMVTLTSWMDASTKRVVSKGMV